MNDFLEGEADEKSFSGDSQLARRIADLHVDGPGSGQGGVEFDAYLPGHPFQVAGVQVYPEAISTEVQIDVQVGGTSVLQSLITDPTANEVTEGTLVTTLADLRGDETENIALVITTNGTGDITEAHTRVLFRPWPMGGDLGA